MSSFWQTEDGWPYADVEREEVDLAASVDDDLLSLKTQGSHLLDRLDGLEREVIAARFGLNGHSVRSMKELHADLGVPRSDLRQALGSGLDKLRTQLT